MQTTAKAADPAKLLQLAHSYSGENLVKIFLNPDGDADQHLDLKEGLLLVRHLDLHKKIIG